MLWFVKFLMMILMSKHSASSISEYTSLLWIAGHQIFFLWFEGGIWNYTFLAPMAQVGTSSEYIHPTVPQRLERNRDTPFCNFCLNWITTCYFPNLLKVLHVHCTVSYWAYQWGRLNLHCHASHEGKWTEETRSPCCSSSTAQLGNEFDLSWQQL